jgi:sucrose-6F-phosphate phosphohydrolase
MRRQAHPRHLLVSDLDDTLLGKPEALTRFRDFCDENPDLLGVVYASGRSCDSIQESIDTTRLPEPLATIGGVGSEIRLCPGREPWRQWWDRISDHWSDREVRRLLAGMPDLKLQPEAAQSAYKVSYHYPDAEPADLRRIENHLKDAGQKISLIYSSGRDLDVLPHEANKGSAASFLIRHLGYGPEAVFTSGNSRNDAHLMGYGFAGIIVGNAHDDLKVLGDRDRVYVAEDTYADGVLEGIRHWLAQEKEETL